MKVWVDVLSNRVVVHGEGEEWHFTGADRLLAAFNFIERGGHEIVDPPETGATPSLAEAAVAAPELVHFAGGVGQPAACGDDAGLWTTGRGEVTCPLCLTGVKRRSAATKPSSAEFESVARSLAGAVASLADAAAVLSDRLSATLAAESASPVGREWVPSQELA